MPETCFVCGKEIPPGKEIRRKGRPYCSVEHARAKKPAPTAVAPAPTQSAKPVPAASAPRVTEPAPTPPAGKAKPATP